MNRRRPKRVKKERIRVRRISEDITSEIEDLKNKVNNIEELRNKLLNSPNKLLSSSSKVLRRKPPGKKDDDSTSGYGTVSSTVAQANTRPKRRRKPSDFRSILKKK